MIKVLLRRRGFPVLALLTAVLAVVALAVAGQERAHAVVTFTEWETNGSYAIGAPSGIGAGNPISEVAHPGRSLYYQEVGCCISGSSYGYLRIAANDNFVAAQNDCSNVTIKSSSSSDGVVWIFKPGSNDQWHNRYCGSGSDGFVMAGLNNGSQFTLCLLGVSCGGKFYNFTQH